VNQHRRATPGGEPGGRTRQYETRGDVTISSIGAALQSAAERMDRETDVLFLILTSHGSQAGVAVQAGRHWKSFRQSISPAC
jgi:hypothetical protein